VSKTSSFRFTSGPIEFREAEANSQPEILGTLYGYAAMFNAPTVIEGERQGPFTEVIAPGAFKKTLIERGSKIRALFNHGNDPTIGDKPLGRFSVLCEDDRGLWMELPLADTSYNRDILSLVRAGALDGQSFRFSTISDRWDRSAKPHPVRTLIELRLYEAGPVTFPAYEATVLAARDRQRLHVPDRTLSKTAAQARLRLLERNQL
jgi:HK97 family phage prohead protease